MDLEQIIVELSKSDVYPFAVDEVEICQTHISAVFLAGEFAYKIKKPVSFGFLDFSTLEKRKHFCEEEVRLNRRLAPDVYLDVVPVCKVDGTIKMEGDGEPVEWAVKMKRLQQDATLEQKLLANEVSIPAIKSLAKKLAEFHKNAKSNEHIHEFGRFDVVARNARENIQQAKSQIGGTISQEVWNRLEQLVKQELGQQHALIEQRAAAGVPCDTHGDLHLDHVYLFPDEKPPNDLVIVDCIEFNERFRFADPIADIAFLAMDLIFHERRDLVSPLMEAYVAATGDTGGRKLLPFYISYRAAVRGKVEGMKLAESEVPAEEQTSALRKSRAHWLLAMSELDTPSNKPCLILMGGLPGTGKSTLARSIAKTANFTIIRSDEVRKELAGVDRTENAGPECYTAEWTERTYHECLRRAEEGLFRGKRVIIDANFWEESKRLQFLDLAATWVVPRVFLYCETSPETARGRIAMRRNDASDADQAIYDHVAGKWQAFGSGTSPFVKNINTSSEVDDSLSVVLDDLRSLQLHG